MQEVGKKDNKEDKSPKKKLSLQQRKDEADKKKKSMIKQAKAKRKKTETLEARMG